MTMGSPYFFQYLYERIRQESLILPSSNQKYGLWLRYVEGTFFIWPYGDTMATKENIFMGLGRPQ